jgi:sugar phosphate isomerase/epimerase
MFKNLNTGAIGIRASLPEAVEMAREHGFGGIDFSIDEAGRLVAGTSIEAVRDLFRSSGINYGAWGVPVAYRDTEEKWKSDLTGLRGHAALARSLGARRATTGVMPFSDTLAFDENYAFHIKRLKPVVEILEDHGIRLGIEFIAPKTLRQGKKYEFIYGLTDTLGLCADLGPNAGLLLDLWHWYTSHGTQDELDNLTNAQVVAVHVNDAPPGIPVDEQMDLVRCLPGETGVLDIAGFLRALQRAGYDGPVTPEPFSKRVNEMTRHDALRTTAQAMNTVWSALNG